MRKIFISFILLIVCSLFSDTNFRVMSYNTLNFDGTDRLSDFQTVFENSEPDILICQEIKTESASDIMLGILNSAIGGYARSNFINDGDLNNMLYYKTSVGTLISQDEINTSPRDISEYVMNIDGNTIRFYSCHLKSSTGYEADRLAAVSILRSHLNALSAGTEFIIVGDMNFYTNSEDGYQKFIANEESNIGRAEDLCSEVGSWHDNSFYSDVHSQSTRVENFGYGATGGLDDKFDFIFGNYGINNGAGIEYSSNSFTSYGNDGDHFNQSINNGTNFAVPAIVADALYYASDHLPIYADFMSTGGGVTELDLIISEYVEGSSYNKYIEIYNGMGSDVNLSDYNVDIYINGSVNPNYTIGLSGVLSDKDVYVLAHNSATAWGGTPDQTSVSFNFNGNDAVVLYKISTSSNIDIFGVIGDHPPEAWTGTGGYSTANKTLVRKSNITGGVTVNPTGTGSSAFTTLTTEWDLYDQDDVSHLGSHDMINLYPSAGDIIITEIDTRFSRGIFVEIYNNTTSTIDLSNCSLIHYNGSSPANLTAALSGQLAAESYYIIARDQTNFVSTYGFEADQYEPIMYLNDGVEWLELDNGSRAIIDNFGASGITWTEDHVFERTGYPNNGTSMDDWIDIGDVLGTPNTNNDNPLPINLSAFYALYIGGIPTLYWTTQSETENAYWNVYRGIIYNFEEAMHLNANNPVPGNGTINSVSDYVYVDTVPVMQNATYWYWIEDVSFEGETEIHEPITVTIPFEETPITPDTYGLHQNYPNPFNPSTSISFALAEDSDVELIIYNIKGAKIRTIFNDHVYANDITSVVWDGNDEMGKQVSSGVYFYKLITEIKEYQRKMLLVK